MTYLEIVNNVLKRMRERPVATVDATSYSTLIGILVNDANKEIEDSWQWSALRTTLTATTTSGIFSYVLTGAGNKPTMLSVLNDTDNHVLEYRSADWFNQQYLFPDQVETGSPRYYTYNGQDGFGDTIVEFYPKPDKHYDIRFNLVLRTKELEQDNQDIYIPVMPLQLLAYAKAIEERGEDGGVMASSAYLAAQRALADAISLDSAKHPEELIWNEV